MCHILRIDFRQEMLTLEQVIDRHKKSLKGDLKMIKQRDLLFKWCIMNIKK